MNGKIKEQDDQVVDGPRKAFIIGSLNMISGLAQGLDGVQFRELMAMNFGYDSAKLLKMLHLGVENQSPRIRAASFYLLGNLALTCPHRLQESYLRKITFLCTILFSLSIILSI